MEEELLAAERLMSVYKEASEDAEKHLSQMRMDFEEQAKLLDESKDGLWCAVVCVCFFFVTILRSIRETVLPVPTLPFPAPFSLPPHSFLPASISFPLTSF